MTPTTHDPLAFDAGMVTRLDQLYSSPQIIEQRRRFRAAVAARPSEVGLDVGCGVGHLTCELAKEVAPGGRVIAIDTSREMVDASRARVAREELGDCVEVRIGNATLLEFLDESLDFVVGVQVYSYVPDVARALQEAARVLRKGGRLLILESDWDMCIWESKDRLFTRRMVDARARHFAHPYLPRQLHRLFRVAGLTLAKTDAFTIIETRYNADSFGAGLIGMARDAAARHGVTTDEAATWEEDLRSRDVDGEYFFCMNRFILAATK